MPIQREVYTFTHSVFMAGAIGLTMTGMYAARHQHPELVPFIESWGLSIGLAATIGTFLFGLSLIGKPIYDDETHRQREAEHDRAVFEWNSKSPEERAIITAARRNELLQLAQILQNDTIIRNQEDLKRK